MAWRSVPSPDTTHETESTPLIVRAPSMRVPPAFASFESSLNNSSKQSISARTLSGRTMSAILNDAGDPKAGLVRLLTGSRRTLGLTGLVLLIFFNTVGSPCGIEPAVGAAGPLLAMLSVLGVAVAWSLPLGLMAAELSLLCEVDGTAESSNAGTLEWVHRGCGPFWGFVNAVNNIAQYLVSNALTLLLVPLYLPPDDTRRTWVLVLVLLGPTVFGCLLNSFSPRLQSHVTLALTPIIFVPFFVLLGVAVGLGKLAHTDGGVLLQMPPLAKISWPVFLSTTIWCAGGIDRVGNAAGEIVGGRATYIQGLLIALLMGVFNYVIPIIICYLIDPHYADWNTGYFSTAGDRVSAGMRQLMVAATVFACVAQYSGAIFPLARLLQSAAITADPLRQLLPRSVGYSYRVESGTVVIPFGGTLLGSVVCFGLAFISYDVLVESYLLLRICNMILQWAALIVLRIREPHAERPFVIPGGYAMLVLMLVPFAAVTVMMLVTASSLSLAIGLGAQPVIVAGYFVRRWFVQRPPTASE